MMNKKIEKALNDQLNTELQAAYLYLALAAHFDSSNLKGFAHWMRAQRREELEHADKIYGFIHERDGQVALQAIDAPPQTWDSPLEAIEDALAGEKEVSQKIGALVELADADRDHATSAFLQWFVKEQVEEEASISDIIQQLKLIGDNNNGLFLLDRDMGERREDEVAA